MPLTLASNAITFTDNTSLSSGIIGTAQLSAGAVTADKVTSLPSNVVTTQTIANSAVTASKMSGGQFGDAPIYGCRAWVTFDATRRQDGTSELPTPNNTNRFINYSGNVARVLRTASGIYDVVFATPMPTINYTVLCSGWNSFNGEGPWVCEATGAASQPYGTGKALSSIRVACFNSTGSQIDQPGISVAVFC